MSHFAVIRQSLFCGGFWPIQGIQNLAGFVSEPVAALGAECLAVLKSESVVVLIEIRTTSIVNRSKLQDRMQHDVFAWRETVGIKFMQPLGGPHDLLVTNFLVVIDGGADGMRLGQQGSTGSARTAVCGDLFVARACDTHAELTDRVIAQQVIQMKFIAGAVGP
jgi:hypothetical protein